MSANPEREQDRVADLCSTFATHRDVMFPQQRAIYTSLAPRLQGKQVLEAGCGNGVGAALLGRYASVVATDKRPENVAFAKALYPWIDFEVWDMTTPWSYQHSAVVCIEAIEHVANVEAAVRNLLAAARNEVWISTPNGTGKLRPPENPYHVCEYTPAEMLSLLSGHRVEILHWGTFAQLDHDTVVDPLVYKVTL